MERFYPIGTPGQPWTDADKAQWSQQQAVQRVLQPRQERQEREQPRGRHRQRPRQVGMEHLVEQRRQVSDDWVAVPRGLHPLRPNSRVL